MNFIKTKKLIGVILIILLSATTVFTQEQQEKPPAGQRGERVEDVVKNPDGSYSTTRFDEAERPDDSYLQKDHAVAIVPYLQKRNIEYLYMLRVIVSNFPEMNWEEDYKNCYDGYRNAMQYFYRRNYIYARLDFQNNYKDLQELMRKVAEYYKAQVLDLLDDCVDVVLTAHMDPDRRSDPDKNKALQKAVDRLRMSYNILDASDDMMTDKYYRSAVIQLRMSRAFCILMLEDFTKPEDLPAFQEKYRIMKADNLNRIYRPAPEKVPIPRD